MSKDERTVQKKQLTEKQSIGEGEAEKIKSNLPTKGMPIKKHQQSRKGFIYIQFCITERFVLQKT